MNLTNLQKRIENAYLAYELSHDKNESVQRAFEAGFLAGIEDTAKRVIQSNDDVISEIDAIVGRCDPRGTAAAPAPFFDRLCPYRKCVHGPSIWLHIRGGWL